MVQILMFFASLFTVKDGLIFIDYDTSSFDSVRAQDDDDAWGQSVFADNNGDDWFYFEDQYTGTSSQEQCAKATDASTFNVRTISGGDTSLLAFEYTSTPPHTVLHEGKCNFAGLKPASTSSRYDPDSPTRFKSQTRHH